MINPQNEIPEIKASSLKPDQRSDWDMALLVASERWNKWKPATMPNWKELGTGWVETGELNGFEGIMQVRLALAVLAENYLMLKKPEVRMRIASTSDYGAEELRRQDERDFKRALVEAAKIAIGAGVSKDIACLAAAAHISAPGEKDRASLSVNYAALRLMEKIFRHSIPLKPGYYSVSFGEVGRANG